MTDAEYMPGCARCEDDREPTQHWVHAADGTAGDAVTDTTTLIEQGPWCSYCYTGGHERDDCPVAERDAAYTQLDTMREAVENHRIDVKKAMGRRPAINRANRYLWDALTADGVLAATAEDGQ